MALIERLNFIVQFLSEYRSPETFILQGKRKPLRGFGTCASASLFDKGTHWKTDQPNFTDDPSLLCFLHLAPCGFVTGKDWKFEV